MRPRSNSLTGNIWLIGLIVLCASAGLIFIPLVQQKLSSRIIESRCMKTLEASAQVASTKTSDERAQMIFQAMATPDCRLTNP